MPIIQSTYKAPKSLFNGHIQTIFPSLFRKIQPVAYKRLTISTNDDDFLHGDFSQVDSNTLAIISHGLEGHTRRNYIQGMVHALNRANIDALAWNFRGCSGVPNKQLRLYHNCVTDDLETVIQYMQQNYAYKNIILIGFSMGGNISLLYLGQKGQKLLQNIVSTVVFSVPCNLTDSSIALAKWSSKIYMKRFLRDLHQKVKMKMEQFPTLIDDKDYNKLKDFTDFDGRYTAPLHGFNSASHYWESCSSDSLLENIVIPTLIVNAKNDPFLLGRCYPIQKAQNSINIFLEMPETGGHVGFTSFNGQNEYWSETRTIEFIRQYL